jgi:hypothetical protein
MGFQSSLCEVANSWRLLNRIPPAEINRPTYVPDLAVVRRRAATRALAQPAVDEAHARMRREALANIAGKGT